MSGTTQHQIKPYARLLTMLGDQLIKNERIALVELIKNSYDADADWVKITFEGFGDNYKVEPNSKIIIEDNGHGMSREIIEKHWLNPATPEKHDRKATRTAKGRIVQGDKGIGRFAVLKLGKKIEVTTRATGDKSEHLIEYDFSKYDDNFLTENKVKAEDPIFLEDLKVNLSSRTPERIINKENTLGILNKPRPAHGTIIEISKLKGAWKEKKIKELYDDLTKFQSIFDLTKKEKAGFNVYIYKDDKRQNFAEKHVEKLELLLDRSVIKIEAGHFDAAKQEYQFKINGKKQIFSLVDRPDEGLRVFKKILKDHFGAAEGEFAKRISECGSFDFSFYVFDFSPNAPGKHKLDKEDKEIIRDHRIYLYRDGIRVYPYGNADDDWLRIDKHRGSIRAGDFLSNDQVVGFIKISEKNNPRLQDKTNREGLIETGSATEDFIGIIRAFLAYVRSGPYSRYLKSIEDKKSQDIFKKEQVRKILEKLKKTLKNILPENKGIKQTLSTLEKEYKAERQYLVQRVETTEDLAGVGLSVEIASHDIMNMAGKALNNLDSLIRDLIQGGEINKEELLKDIQSIRGGVGFIEDQLSNIQLIFTSSKRRRKPIRVEEIVEKVATLYKRLMLEEDINFTIKKIGSPLVAKTTDAVLLQTLLNLFDNSIHWLEHISKANKSIEILLDGHKSRMIFADNGIGIDEDDKKYIFEPFYSSKGEEGRGLGLYIARQLLERHDYAIELAELKSEKILSGANFIVNFVTEKK